MIGLEMIAVAQAAQRANIEYRLEMQAERAFREYIKDLPAEQQARMIVMRHEAQAQARKERNDERRHQELCSAIRASGQDNSFRPFDFFLLAAAISN